MSFDLPTLPEGWSYVPLEQLAQKNSVTYGVVQPGTHVEHGVPIVRVNNFKEGRVELSELMRIDPEIEEKYGRTRLQGGEVLLTVVGSVGQVAVVSEALKGFNVARAVAVIHPQQQVDPNWLALCLRSPLSQHLLGSRANTTVQTTINLKDLRALPVPMAPEYERGKIIELIGSLDDRITLLRETNATLEAIAKALFKSWFVDFDPVRAKAEGLEPEGMDAATAALFPNSFEESELGLVPMGWTATKFGDFIDRLSVGQKYDQKSAFPEGIVPILDQGRSGIIGYHNDSPGVKASLDEPVVVFANHTCYMRLITFDFSAIQNVLPFKGRAVDTVWAFYATKDRTKLSEYKGHWPDFAIEKLPRPSEDLTRAFRKTVGPIIRKIRFSELQSKTLTQLRDTLLPRLISGQLRLPGTEAFVENMLSVAV